MLPGDDETLLEVLKGLPTEKVDGLFCRLVSPKWVRKLDSSEGSRVHGGRFNPPVGLAESLCNISDGFGLLYTADSPITCLFECRHVLRGLPRHAFQFHGSEPSLIVTFNAQSDRVLSLCSAEVCEQLGLLITDLTALDTRYDVNAAGKITALQRLGAAVYKIGRFSGILTPSRFTDVIPSVCFDFLPGEVKPILRDTEKLIDCLTFDEKRLIRPA